MGLDVTARADVVARVQTHLIGLNGIARAGADVVARVQTHLTV